MGKKLFLKDQMKLLELKNKIIKTKYSLEGLKSKFEVEEERMSEPEDKLIRDYTV